MKSNNSDFPSKNDEKEKLSETCIQYLDFLELARDVIFTLSPDGLVTSLNDAFKYITGWEMNEWIGKSFMSLIHPEDIPLVMERFSNLLKGNTSKSIEVRIKIKSGGYIYCQILASYKIKKGEIIEIIGIGREITEQKNREILLKKGEESYRQLFDSSPDGVVLIGTDGRILQANKAQARMYCYDSPIDLVGVHATQLVALSSRDYSSQIMRRRLNGEDIPPVEYELVRRDGTIFFGETSASILYDEDHKVSGYICITRDTTERKLAKKILEESENKFKSAFMTSQDAIYLGTLEEGLIIEINDAFEELFGYKREETLGNTSLQLNLFHQPDDRKKIVSELKANGLIRNLEISGRKKGGEITTISMSISTLMLSNKPHILGILRDITESKLAEQELIQAKNNAEEKEIILQGILDNLQDAFFQADLNGNFTFVNSTSISMYGYSSISEMIGMPASKLYADKNEREVLFKELNKTGKIKDYRGQALRKDGTTFWVSMNVQFLKDDNGNIVGSQGVVRDITERKNTEMELLNYKEHLEQVNEQLEHLYLQQSEVIETERKAISREIHDELGQSLTALMIDLEWSSDNIEDKSGLVERINEMTAIVANTIKKVQKISSNLRPDLLDDLGLIPAIEWYMSEFGKRTGIEYTFKSNGFQYASEKINLVLYRILQESLTNVIRHAQSKNVLVNLFQADELLTLDISDDGIGFDLKKLDSRESLGFISIRERLKPFHGTLEITSVINQGTKLNIKIPTNLMISR